MINNRLPQLLQAEKLSGISMAEQKKLPYKRFNQVWIRADKPLNEIYTKSVKHSELQFYPNKYYKAWGVWFLTQLKFKKGGHKLSNLLGIGLRWHFTKTVYLPLKPDVIYGRHDATVMVYASLKQKKVIKVAFTDYGKFLMKSEIKSQQLASSIESEDIFIPTILMEFHDKHLDFYVEEYFQGRRQSFKDKNVLEANYHKVFQFVLKFYFSNPIELQYLSESEFINHDFVEDFIRNQECGDKVISTFKQLNSKRKKMILCRIHNDLSHNNILANSEKVCIIDWGKSKLHYLARDLDNLSYDTEGIYVEVIKMAEIDKKEVYSYKEQLFLARYIEMNRLIHNGITRKTITAYLYAWTAQQNQVLIKMAVKL